MKIMTGNGQMINFKYQNNVFELFVKENLNEFEIIIERFELGNYKDNNSKNFKDSNLVKNIIPLLNFNESKQHLNFKKNDSYLNVDSIQRNNPLSYKKLSLKPLHFYLPYFIEPKLNKDIKEFQKEGINWLVNNKRGILADDMGLGKTVQAIMAIRFLIYNDHIKNILILCPKSLVKNWVAEIQKWAPELSVIDLNPPANLKNIAWDSCIEEAIVKITNYESFKEKPKYFLENKIDVLICDEAHRLRKNSSQISSSVATLKTDFFWMLSGSPIEKDEKDLSTLLSILNPRKFSSNPDSFELSTLATQGARYIKRRLKNDILKELPTVHEEKPIIINLTPNQKREYEKVIEDIKASNNNLKDSFKILNKLLTICDYDIETDESNKINKITENLLDIKKKGEKAVVFSYLVKPLNLLKKKLDENKIKSVIFDGQLDQNDRSKIIEHFKQDEAITCFLASMRAGGEGLTLTEANHVLFINRWWNPSTNFQARDRVVRLGQKREVFIKYYVSKDTIEENLSEILKNKEEISIRNIESSRIKSLNNINDEKDVLNETMMSLKKIIEDEN